MCIYTIYTYYILYDIFFIYICVKHFSGWELHGYWTFQVGVHRQQGNVKQFVHFDVVGWVQP